MLESVLYIKLFLLLFQFFFGGVTLREKGLGRGKVLPSHSWAASLV